MPHGILYEAEPPKQRSVVNGYVFICSNRTEAECLDNRVFAMPEWKWSVISQVKKGDILFLLNHQNNHLHGVFEATSDAGRNIVPYAFGGRFPGQVRVKRKLHCSWVDKGALIPLIRRRMITVSREGTLLFPTRLNQRLMDELYRIFLEIPPAFRSRRESTDSAAKDGHLTRSYGERAVDDWLHDHLPYKHLYGSPLQLSGHVIRSDWHIPEIDVHIEYWEEPDPIYRDSLDIKQKLYADHSLKVVNVYENDLPSLDHVIPRRIAELVPKCKFRGLAGKRRTPTTRRHRMHR